LLIGRTLTLLETPGAATGGESGNDISSLLIGFMALVVLTVLLAVGLTWWFRRSDRYVQSRLAGALTRDFQVPEPDDDPPIARRDAISPMDAGGTDQTPLRYHALPPPRFTMDSNDPKSS
jgi:hypothetical protein